MTYVIVQVPVVELKPNHAQMRSMLDVEEMADLTLQIQTDGLDTTRPIVVGPKQADDKRPIISGHRRFLAYLVSLSVDKKENLPEFYKAAFAEMKTYEKLVEHLATKLDGTMVDVLEQDGNAQREVLTMLSHNFGQVPGDTLGLAHAFQIAQADGCSVTAIGNAIGKPRAYVEQYLALNGVSSELRDLIAKDKMALQTALVLWRMKKKDRREALDAVLVARNKERQHITLEEVRAIARDLEKFEGFPAPVSEATPHAWLVTLLAHRVWTRNLAEAPLKMWQAVAQAATAHTPAAVTDLFLTKAEPELVTVTGWGEAHPDFVRLLAKYMPEVRCSDCPLSKLPTQVLQVDLDKRTYPCRSNGTLPGACLYAPGLAGAPWFVECPWQWGWLELKDVVTVNNIKGFANLETLLAAFEQRKAKEHKEVETAVVVPEGTNIAQLAGVGMKRAQIRGYMERHTKLAHSHPLAGSCATCNYKCTMSPVKADPKAPPCQWSKGAGEVEFFVRVPTSGTGLVIPVCRQYMPKDTYTWNERIPKYAAGDVTIPRDMMFQTILNALQQTNASVASYHDAQRVALEALSGRPLRKALDHRHWVTDQLAATKLTDEQLMTLMVWALGERQGMCGWYEEKEHKHVKTYQLYVGGKLYQEYADQKWPDYWKAHGVEEKEEEKEGTYAEVVALENAKPFDPMSHCGRTCEECQRDYPDSYCPKDAQEQEDPTAGTDLTEQEEEALDEELTGES